MSSQIEQRQTNGEDSQAKRPLTLSPTYRYKKEQVIDNYNHILKNQMSNQVASPSNHMQVASLPKSSQNQQQRPTNLQQTSNEAFILPTPGGATPTSMLSNQAANPQGASRQPNTTELGVKQQSKPLLIKQVNNSCLLNKDQTVQGAAGPSSSLQPTAQQSISQSNPSYKMPQKLISSAQGGLTSQTGHPDNKAQPQVTYMNLSSQMVTQTTSLIPKTQQAPTQFMNARQSNSHNMSVAQPQQVAAAGDALPDIMKKQIGSADVSQNNNGGKRGVMDSNQPTIPNIFDGSKQNTKTEMRSEFSKQKITDQRSGLTNKSVINNKTFTIKNNNSRTSSQAVGNQIGKQEDRAAVEVNYGIQSRRTILGHQNPHNLSRQGESQLIKAGKLATTQNVQPAVMKDDQQIVINSGPSQGGREVSGVKASTFAQQMTLNAHNKGGNPDSQYQATINSSNKYLFHKTAAYVNNDSKHFDANAESSEYTKMGPANVNTEHESDRSITDKIHQFNSKIGHLGNIRNVENKSFYNQSHMQRNKQGSLGKVNQQSVFLNTTKANMHTGTKSGNKSHYTTFNGPFEVHASPNQHVVSGDLHSYSHQFQGNARQVLNPSQHAQSDLVPKHAAQGKAVTSGDIKTSQQLQHHENQLKIKKFLNLVDLQDLVEKETQYRLNQAGEIVNHQPQKSSDTNTSQNSKGASSKQEALSKMMQSKAHQLDLSHKHKIDPALWKHFQNLLYFDHQNNALNQKLSLNQRKILINLRQQVLKNGFIGMNSEEITKTVKQFVEYFNLDEVSKTPQAPTTSKVNSNTEVKKDGQPQQFVTAFQQSMMSGNHTTSDLNSNQQMQYNRTEKNFSKQTGGVAKSQQNTGMFAQAAPKSGPGMKSMSEAGSTINNFQGGNGARVININKLNINIQQYAHQPSQTTIQNGVQGVSYSGMTNASFPSRNNQMKQYPTNAAHAQYTQSNLQQAVPKQIQDTLFIMDCQLLGLLKNIHLLNLDTAKQMPLSQEKDTKMSEAELVHFFMTRANSAITMMFKELPKLSEEAKQIINMIKAQQQVDLQDEISKIDTLIIEIDYADYKNKLLQALFNNYGDTVLETIIHKIQQGSTEAETIKNLNSRHFQTINEYVDSIRNLHVQQQKMTPQQMTPQQPPFINELQKQTGLQNLQAFSNQVINLTSPEQEFVPQIFGEELSENLAYLYPNIYDPTMKSLNFTPGYRGKRYKDKKINFGVMVKETKLYHALKCADQLASKYNQTHQGPQGAPGVGKQDSKKCLSSFLVTHDCTLLRFMLFCSHAGIIRSAQACLRLFFKNVFIVIKAGSQLIQSTGKVYHHTTLPQVDVEKVTNYIQNQLKKKQKALENQAQLKRFNSIAENNGKDGLPTSNAQLKQIQSAQRGQSSNATPTLNKPFKNGGGTTTGMSIDRNKSTVSLNSYKSLRNLENATAKIDIAVHFNSFNSSIRAEFCPEKATTIKIYHQPYTHLNQSRFQKTFKIYNEFVQLTFKNKLIYAQPGEASNSDIQDFTQVQAARICKLGSQMGIKDLPKKHSLLRAPLLELFRNHRQLQKIKEQVLRYLFKILNEENEISANFNHIVLSGNSFFVDKEFTKVKNQSKQMDDQNQEGTTPPPNFIIQHQKTVSQMVSAQKNLIYKYQVGYGNNHFLIKSIMKNRRWWHQATTKDNVSNFEDAQIIWTQWCKNKLCNHLSMTSQFKFEFKMTLDKLEKKCHFKPGEPQKKFPLSQNDTKQINDKSKAAAQNTSPNKDTNMYREAKNQKMTSSRQQKKQNVFSTQYKSIENHISSPERQQEEEKQGTTQKSGKKKNGKKQKSIDGEESQTDELEGIGEQSKNQGDDNSIKIPKMFRQVKAMKDKFQRVYNRLEFNQHLNNKKALFINMRNFYNYCCEGDVFNTLPLTFHIKDGVNDPNFKEFTKYFYEQKAICAKDHERKNVWVIKPGENSNRGVGIKVESEFSKITQACESSCSKYGNDGKKTVIVQKYIDNPMLYNKRKFDVRCFCLVTCHNGIMKAYFYRDGYIRTASKEFTLQNLNNKFIHLVNDAIQQNSDEYGKFETANKLSYQDFQKSLNQTQPEMNINMERDIIMQIKKIVTDTIRATFHLLDNKRRLNSYELFGYDFMFDADVKPFLIEVNSNPCLEFSSSLLAKIFTSMLDNTLRIAVDPLFPPSQEGFASKKSAEGIDLCPENRFDLIFDERIDGPALLEKLNRIKLEDINEVKALDELEQSEEDPESEIKSEGPEGINRLVSNESVHGTTPQLKEETEKEEDE